MRAVGYVAGDSGRQSENLGVVARNQRSPSTIRSSVMCPKALDSVSSCIGSASTEITSLIAPTCIFEIQGCGFRDTDTHLLHRRSLEPAAGCLHFVGTRRQQRNHVSSIALRGLWF